MKNDDQQGGVWWTIVLIVVTLTVVFLTLQFQGDVPGPCSPTFRNHLPSRMNAAGGGRLPSRLCIEA